MSEGLPICELPAITGKRFRFGDPVRLRMRPDGSIRLETWRDRWASAIAETFWPRPVFTVTHIDRAAGKITIG